MPRPKRDVVLVFGENDNDRASIIELVRALKPNTSAHFIKLSKPLIHLRSADQASTRRRVTDDIEKLVRASSVLDRVVGLIAHRDCDAVEPAHVALKAQITTALKHLSVPYVVAATPAFEMEAWWLLFPEAVNAVRPCWRKISEPARHVGHIENAKEHLVKVLEPTETAKRNSCPRYCESDSVAIARQIRSGGHISRFDRSKSESLSIFVDDIVAMNI